MGPGCVYALPSCCFASDAWRLSCGVLARRRSNCANVKVRSSITISTTDSDPLSRARLCGSTQLRTI